MTGTGAAGAVATVSWTLRCAVGAGGRRVLPRRVDGVVRGGRGRRLRVRPGPERAAEAGARAAAVALAQPGAGQRAGVAAVPRFPLSDAGELEPQAAGGGQGGVAAGRGARGQPALRGDQPRVGADRDPAAVRTAVLRARGHGEPHQGAAAGPVRGPDFGGDASGEPVAAVLGPVRGGAAGGGRGGAGERAEGLGVVVLGVSAPGAVRAQPGAVAGGDAGIACGPAGGVFTLRQFAEQDGQSAPEPVPVDADMATRGDS